MRKVAWGLDSDFVGWCWSWDLMVGGGDGSSEGESFGELGGYRGGGAVDICGYGWSFGRDHWGRGGGYEGA